MYNDKYFCINKENVTIAQLIVAVSIREIIKYTHITLPFPINGINAKGIVIVIVTF